MTITGVWKSNFNTRIQRPFALEYGSVRDYGTGRAACHFGGA
jgi:hypothetical protein